MFVNCYVSVTSCHVYFLLFCQALISLLTESCFRYFSPIIVYCTRQQETERVAQLIRTCLQGNQLPGNRKERNGDVSQPPVWSAEAYHARVSPSRRHSIQKQFENGKLRVVVATVAFGMGIDKSDVRGIIHYNLPKSIENYIQEIGRAGRDGCPAHCHAFIDSEVRVSKKRPTCVCIVFVVLQRSNSM